MESLIRAWCAWHGFVLLPVMGPLGARAWVVAPAGGGFFMGADSLDAIAAALGIPVP